MVTKRKVKQKSTRLNWFYPSQHFQLVSYYPVDEVMVRLQSRHERSTGWFASHKKLRVTINQKSKMLDIRDFRLDKDLGRNLRIEAIGTLEYIDEHTTLVDGISRIQTSSLIVMCLLFCTHVIYVGGVVGVISGLVFGQFFGLFSLGLLIKFYVMELNGRDQLIRTIEATVR